MRTELRWAEPLLLFGVFSGAAWLAPLAGTWTVPLQSVLGALAVVALSWSARRDGVTLADLGLTHRRFLVGSAVYLLVTATLLAPTLWIARVPSIVIGEVPVYWAWALFQQFLVVAGFWRHFRWLGASRGAPRNLTAAAVTALVFALAHAPNLRLMAFVGVGELVWLLLFTRFRNLLSLSLAHAGAALVVSHALVPEWVPTMRIGLHYLER
jgi:Type II CAAX prenyl endopeptidase Rce1-like